MTTILQINSSARSQGAQSTLLANELTAKLQQSNPGAQVVVRNLHEDALPHLDDAILGAFFTPAVSCENWVADTNSTGNASAGGASLGRAANATRPHSSKTACAVPDMARLRLIPRPARPR